MIAPFDENKTLASFHRMPLVDALRMIAALMVLAYHYLFRGFYGNEGFSPLAFPALAPYAKYGFLGVHWFFMISGLVIAYSSAGRTAPEFTIARISRLLPGAWASIFFLFVVFTVFPLAAMPTNFATLFANLSFLPQAFHAPMQSASFWSIQIELAFYVWVAVLIACRVWPQIILIICAWLAITDVNGLAFHALPLNYIFITRYAPLFCLGILLYDVRQNGMRWPIMGLMAVSLVLAAFSVFDASLEVEQNYHTTFDPVVLVGMLYGMFAVLAFAAHAKLSERWQRICYVMGGMTYPLYLVHESLGYRIFWALHHSHVPAWVQFFIAAACAMIVATLIWVLVERPLIPRLRNGLQNLLARFRPVRHKARQAFIR